MGGKEIGGKLNIQSSGDIFNTNAWLLLTKL